MIKIIDITHRPIQYIGKVAGVCYGSDTSDETKNYKRGIDCLTNNHGRTFEYPDVTLEISEYSNRVVREIYTAIVGVTRLQESTRYLNMSEKFESYYTPKSIKMNEDALALYEDTMDTIKCAYETLKLMGIPKEDLGNLVPLGQHTKIVLKINLRALIHMFEIRTCTRAYVEYRSFMSELKKVLSEVDKEWAELCNDYFVTKCVRLGYCDEKKSCGRYKTKQEAMAILNKDSVERITDRLKPPTKPSMLELKFTGVEATPKTTGIDVGAAPIEYITMNPITHEFTRVQDLGKATVIKIKPSDLPYSGNGAVTIRFNDSDPQYLASHEEIEKALKEVYANLQNKAMRDE